MGRNLETIRLLTGYTVLHSWLQPDHGACPCCNSIPLEDVKDMIFSAHIVLVVTR